MKRQDLSFLDSVSEIDWARLAAYIDGEGCLVISGQNGASKSSRRVYYAELRIANTDFRLLGWLKAKFGGAFHVYRKNTQGRLPCGSWAVASRHAAVIVTRCLPYFIVKKEQAEVILAFQATILPDRRYGRSGRPKELIAHQDTLVNQLSDLKGPIGQRRGRRKDETSMTIQ